MNGVINFRSESGILTNISCITGVPEKEIISFVDSLKDFENGDVDHRKYWQAFVDKFRVNPQVTGTVFFHGCRCLRSNDFRNGLLPNYLAIDKIWEDIWSVCSDHVEPNNLEEMRSLFEDSKESKTPGGYFER